MLFRFGRAFAFVGWLLTAAGIVYLIVGGRGLLDGTRLAPSLVIVGLVAVVVGTSLVRWARRARDRE